MRGKLTKNIIIFVILLSTVVSVCSSIAQEDRGERILYYNHRDTCGDVFIINFDGTNNRRLTSFCEQLAVGENINIDVKVSANGVTAAVRVGIFTGQGNSTRQISNDLYSLSLDNFELVKLTEMSLGEVDLPGIFTGELQLNEVFVPDILSVNLSPNGEFIFLSGSISPNAGNQEIYRLRHDGSEIINLTNAPVSSEAYPAASLDGKWLAVSGMQDGELFEIVVMDIEGQNPNSVTRNSTHDLYYPYWSPDSTKIAYFDWGSPRNTPPNWMLYVVDAAGGTPRYVMDWQEPRFGSPRWSLDSTRLLFSRSENGDYDIFTIDADGTNLTNLTQRIGWDSYPIWSPDGSQIAYHAQAADGSTAAMVMNADGSNPKKLNDNIPPGLIAWLPDPETWNPPVPECFIRSASEINIRAGAGTGYEIAGKLSVGQYEVDKQNTDTAGYTWWHLIEGGWVRADLVEETLYCDRLPLDTTQVFNHFPMLP